MELVLSLEEKERERGYEIFDLITSSLPVYGVDTWYRRTVRAHPARTRCSRLRAKAVHVVRPDGTDVSPRTDGR
jgi:hypothetical protein